MTDSSVADGEDRDPPVPQKPRHEGLSIGLFVIFAMMLWLVVISVAYAVSMIDIVIGTFTFRVGPADFDPSTAVCGRWPRDVTQLPDLSVMHIDWLGMPISIFGLSLLFLGLTVFVYLRISRRVKATYRHRPMPSGAA
jgi:hypothetical protein